MDAINMMNGAIVHDEYTARSRVWVHLLDKVFYEFSEGSAVERAEFDATEDDTAKCEGWQNRIPTE
jgi:hypothetical protein